MRTNLCATNDSTTRNPRPPLDLKGLQRLSIYTGYMSQFMHHSITETAKYKTWLLRFGSVTVLDAKMRNALTQSTVTGASNGFGRILTEVALEKGDIVVATAHSPSALADLTSKYPLDRLPPRRRPSLVASTTPGTGHS